MCTSYFVFQNKKTNFASIIFNFVGGETHAIHGCMDGPILLLHNDIIIKILVVQILLYDVLLSFIFF